MKLTLVLIFFSCVSIAQTLKINISGIRNSKGTIRLAFYNTSESFDKEKALFFRIEPKTTMVNGALNLSYSDLKPGVYGIAILDDENNDQKMDYGWVLPKEGFGFSDYYHTSMSRPKFESFDFILKNEIKSIQIKLRYL
jgi:uncharacterized protein (DUF2141 family)